MAAPAPIAGPLMRVHFIDVGQGAATLFEFPCGAVLVDTGCESNGMFDSTEQLNLYLEEFFAERPDLDGQLTSLVITHPHIDHTRGVRVVRDRFAPKNVLTNGQTNGSGGAQQKMLHRYAADHEGDVGFKTIWLDDIPALGLTSEVIDPLDCADGIDPKVTVMWGQVRTNPGWGASAFKNPNNHSLVVRIDFGEASVLVTGDLESEAIQDLVARYQGTDLLNVDIYQVGHHGSDNGTTDELIAAVTPECAVVCMGPNEREAMWTAWAYGHPRAGIIDALQAGVSGTRQGVDVQVASGVSIFQTRHLTHAIHGTGWDGTVVMEAGVDGRFQMIAPQQTIALINVNTAPAQELEALPGIGPAKARAIVEDRAMLGPYASLAELTRVRGIGPATVEVLRNSATVGN